MQRLTLLSLASLSLVLATGCSKRFGDGDGGPDKHGEDDGGGGEGGGDEGGGDGGETGEDDPVDADGDGSYSDEDCDDADATVYPGAEELCDGKDNDCDGVSEGEGDADLDGLYDCEDYCPIQVDLTAPAGGDGSFARPFQVVQDGIDEAPIVGCYEIDVHPGTYTENIDFMGYDVDVRGVDGPLATVLDGGGAGSVVTIASGESASARLTGFTVTNGSATKGGGIYIEASDPRIEDNIITDNEVTGSPASGGGVYLYDSDAEISANEITDNVAGYGGDDDGNDGGGITILYGAPLVQGNVIASNLAGDGGGIWVARSDATILHNVIDSNEADDAGVTDDSGYTLTGQGGGVDFQADTDGVSFTNNIVTNNVAGSHGGGVAAIGYYVETDVAEPLIAYNTIAFNEVSSGSYGDGLCVWGVGSPTVTGNILYANGSTGLYSQYAYAVVEYNLSNGQSSDWAGALGNLDNSDGNLGSTPGFMGVSDDGDWTNDDFHLKSGSAAVDAGDPADSDADGTDADMGAYGGPDGAW